MFDLMLFGKKVGRGRALIAFAYLLLGMVLTWVCATVLAHIIITRSTSTGMAAVIIGTLVTLSQLRVRPTNGTHN